MSTPALDRFVRPARLRSELWRLVLGTLVMTGTYVGLTVLAGAVVALFLGPAAVVRAIRWMAAGDSAAAVLAVLASFALMALGPITAVRLVHRRRAATLFGRAPVVLRDFVLAAVIVLAVYAPGLVLWSLQFDAAPGLPVATWAVLLPLALVGLLLQTGAEEMVFRGYLLQQLAARFRSPLAWAVLPSLLFGALHYAPAQQGGLAPYTVAATALFGLAAADLTARSGSLGAAWGFHFANNTIALLLLGTSGSLSGLALFVTPYTAADLELAGAVPIGDIAMLLLAWAVVRRAVRR